SGADPNDGVTLTIAAGAGDVPTLELLRRYGANLNQSWATDGSATLYASLQWATTPEGVQWLLEHGADPDPVFAANGETALHRAAEEGDTAVLALLLDCGFDPNRADEEIGKTALHSAAMAGQPDAVRVLLAHAASPHIRDREFNGPPLVWAAEGSRSHGD